MENLAQERAGRLADDLMGAATRCELELHLQPEVEIASGHLTGAEALLRWYHPKEGLFWPADVLPLAHARGGVGHLTSWVLGTAAAAALRWPETDGTPRTCWVNVPGEAAAVSAAVAVGLVRRLGLPEGRLGLHVPAASLAFDPASAARWIADCRAAGLPVLADGLGACERPERIAAALHGQSQALTGLPLTGVVLTRDAVRHSESAEVAETISDIAVQASTCGWDLSGVGVESWEEADRLGGLGVTRATGHLFGAAVRPDRMRWLLGREGDTWRGSFAGDRKGRLHVDHDVLEQTRQLRPAGTVPTTGIDPATMPVIPRQRAALEQGAPVS